MKRDFLAGRDLEPPFTLRKEFDPRDSAFRYLVQEVKRFPVEWSLLLGDFCHNARACLDYLAWILVKGGDTPIPTDPQKIGFPICDDPKGRVRFESAAGVLVPGISKRPLAVIRQHQPYVLKDQSGLRVLRVLNNVDKHRNINGTHTYHQGQQPFAVEVIDSVDFLPTDTRPGKDLIWCLENHFCVDAELAVVSGTVTGSNPNVKVSLRGNVAAVVRHGTYGWFVPDVFDAVANEVGTILDEMEPILGRAADSRRIRK